MENVGIKTSERTESKWLQGKKNIQYADFYLVNLGIEKWDEKDCAYWQP